MVHADPLSQTVDYRAWRPALQRYAQYLVMCRPEHRLTETRMNAGTTSTGSRHALLITLAVVQGDAQDEPEGRGVTVGVGTAATATSLLALAPTRSSRHGCATPERSA
jgi:hypothetical protein